MAAGLGAPELAAAAKRLEEVHKALDGASARFAEESFTFSGILTKTVADTVLDAASEAAGIRVRVADRGPGALPSEAVLASWELLPVLHAAEGTSFDLAGGIDRTAFQPRAGRVPVEAIGQLALVGPAVKALRERTDGCRPASTRRPGPRSAWGRTLMPS
jgi:hypothetical protein